MPFFMKPGQDLQAISQPVNKDEIRARKLAAINDEYWRRRDGGVFYNGHWFKSDSVAQAEYNFLSTKAQEKKWPDEAVLRQKWRCMCCDPDKAAIDMTYGLLKKITDEGARVFFAIDDAKQAHKAALIASDDPASYDISTLWPKIYSE